MSRPSASELRKALRAGLAERLAPDAWRPVDEGARRSAAVAMVRTVKEDFVATVEVWQAGGIPDRPPVRITYMHVGVGYEPLRRLSPLLDMFDLDVRSTLVWPHSFSEDDEDDDDETDDDEEDEQDGFQPREVRSLEEAHQLAGELAAIAQERAVAYALRYADFDVLLASVRGSGSWSVLPAALLASAGRFDEARLALAQMAPPAPGKHWMRDEQRAARQLGRWIESGGDLTLIPDAPPPPRFQAPPSLSMSSLWQRSRATSAAVSSVKRERRGKDRTELRAMLERELALRGVTQSPLWFEQTLDRLHSTPAETGELLIKGLITVGKFGIEAIQGIRDERPLLDQLPDLSVPEWLNPPARAAWVVPRRLPDSWVEVEVARESSEWLDRAYRAIPRFVGTTASLEAWFQWDTGEQRRLAVHIGERRVGTLDETATTAYSAVMKAAGSRDESPYAQARLTPRPARESYLLEVQVPG